jgi:hypothetical protein
VYVSSPHTYMCVNIVEKDCDSVWLSLAVAVNSHRLLCFWIEFLQTLVKLITEIEVYDFFFAIGRLTMHWCWSGTWRKTSRSWSIQALRVLARQLSTFAYTQDVQCTPLLGRRRNGISSKSSTHRYVNSPSHYLEERSIGQAEAKLGTRTRTRSMYLVGIFVSVCEI